MSRRKNRNVERIIGLAAMAGLGRYYAEGGTPEGGGAAPPEDKEKGKKAKDEPKKIELTEDELKAQIEAARIEERNAAAEKERKAKEETDEKAAKEKGEYKTLWEGSESRVKELEAEARKLKIQIAVNDHLAEKHAEYVGVAKYIIPQIPADVTDDGLAEAVKTAAAAYVKDNPREAKGGSKGAPDAPPRTGNRDAKPRQGGMGTGRASNGEGFHKDASAVSRSF